MPIDSDVAGNRVVEGAPVNTPVDITVSSTAPQGQDVVYALTGDSSGGGFKIDPVTGVVSVADSTKIDFESSGLDHSYTITAQASDGALTSSQTFTVAVTNMPPSMPIDINPAANTVAEGAAAGTTVGITAFSNDVNGPALTYVLIGDTSRGGFAINFETGVVTVADPTKINFEGSGPNHTYTITAQVSDGSSLSIQSFTIAVTDPAPSVPANNAHISVVEVESAPPVLAQQGSGASVVGGAAGHDASDASQGVLISGAGADNFVFRPSINSSAPVPPPPHIADGSAAHGDSFDFSALISSFHAFSVADGSLVRATEYDIGKLMALPVRTALDVAAFSPAPETSANRGNITLTDNAHAGDIVKMLVASQMAAHLPEVHVDWLVHL